VAVASAGPYASLHLAVQITTPAPHYVFTGRMPFLPPNQQRQSTAIKTKVKQQLQIGYFVENNCIVFGKFLLLRAFFTKNV